MGYCGRHSKYMGGFGRIRKDAKEQTNVKLHVLFRAFCGLMFAKINNYLHEDELV